MQFAMLIYETEAEFERRKHLNDETFWAPWRAYQRALVEAGIYLGGDPLEPPATTATTIRIRGGQRHVQDGPFADTKEQLGGFMILEAPTLDVVLSWAAKCPAAAYGSVEIRPVADLTRIFGVGSQGLPARV